MTDKKCPFCSGKLTCNKNNRAAFICKKCNKICGKNNVSDLVFYYFDEGDMILSFVSNNKIYNLDSRSEFIQCFGNLKLTYIPSVEYTSLQDLMDKVLILDLFN
jgi:hypothetical protein